MAVFMWYSSSRSVVPVTSNPQNRVAFGFSATVRDEQNRHYFKTKKSQTCSSKKQSGVCVILSIFLATTLVQTRKYHSIYRPGLKMEGHSKWHSSRNCERHITWKRMSYMLYSYVPKASSLFQTGIP